MSPLFLRFLVFTCVQAARVLEGIVLDSPHRQVKVHYKVTVLVRIASLWLLEDDYARAEEKIHKAANMIKDREVRDDPILNLKYKSCFAQISDFKRKFLDAASKYYELSHLISDKVYMFPPPQFVPLISPCRTSNATR